LAALDHRVGAALQKEYKKTQQMIEFAGFFMDW
jgi:hypothetical protein